MLALEPVDHAAAHTDLAESYLKGGKRAEAKKQTLAALEIAPSYERAQDLLLKLVGGDSREAAACASRGPPRWSLAALDAAARCLLSLRAGLDRVDAQLPAPPTIASPACSGASSASSITTSPKARRVPQDFYGEPWAIDGPAAEQNLSRRVKTATAIQVEDPIVLTLDDPRLFTYPWIYIVEPGNLRLIDSDVPILREFLLRGGTLMFDDFHGPLEWDHLRARDEAGVSRSRDRRDPEGPSGLQLLLQARRLPAGRRPRLVHRRPQLGEGRLRRRTCARSSTTTAGRCCSSTGTPTWATAGSGRTPRNIPATSSTPSLAYRMGINEVVYALTH